MADVAGLPEAAFSVLKWQQCVLFVVHWALAIVLTVFATTSGVDYTIPVDMGFNRWANSEGGGCSEVRFRLPATAMKTF